MDQIRPVTSGHCVTILTHAGMHHYHKKTLSVLAHTHTLTHTCTHKHMYTERERERESLLSSSRDVRCTLLPMFI